ncbi:MAG: hypothetical protein IH840_13485 [Candidatus Heimdallarchaeota archaeon]|nr:hypothetical protein [Candidatus Heimdallarchaeota archaeon]
MVSTKDVPKDQTYISVGFRIPKYLLDFVERYEDKSKKITKSEVFRKFLEILYHQPLLIDNYNQDRPISADFQSTIDEKMDVLSQNFKQLEKSSSKQIEDLKKLMEQIDSRTKLIESVTEKMLGISFNRILGAPEHVLDQLYAKFVDESK